MGKWPLKIESFCVTQPAIVMDSLCAPDGQNFLNAQRLQPPFLEDGAEMSDGERVMVGSLGGTPKAGSQMNPEV